MPPKKSKVIEGLDTHHPRSVVQFRPADWSSKLIASGLSTEPFTLHYFAIRGLGELPRLMMELAQIPYDSVMYWDSTEYKELAPFGQLPLLMGGDLDDNDMILSQSSSITRYIAKETNLDGSENGAVGEARADMVFECSKDLSANMGAIHASTDEERAKFHAMLAKTVDLLDEFEGPWFSGMCVTYGDVGMWQVLATVEELKPGYLKKHDFETLATFVTEFAELPPIANYLASPRRMPITANEIGDTPWAADGYKYKTPLSADAYAEEYVEPACVLGGDEDDDETDSEDDEDEEELAEAGPTAKKSRT